MECSTSDLNVSRQKRQRTEDKTRSAKLDFGVLDCPICIEPLSIPIYHCDNGHLACYSCCSKLGNKCPSCALPVGQNRCRAMESVVESVFVPCKNAKYGCTKNVTFAKEATHEKECTFAEYCACPIQDCNYTASYKDLHDHYKSNHQKIDSSYQPHRQRTRFSCGTTFSIKMNISDKILIQREYIESLLFAVQCFREPCGVYVTVSYIAPSTPEVGNFSYRLSYTMDGKIMTYESPDVKTIREVSFQTPQDNYMLIPHNLVCGEFLEMKLCINRMPFN